MAGFNHGTQQYFGARITLQYNHLGTRDHDITHLHIVHMQHALEHGKQVGIKQGIAVGTTQQLDKLFGVIVLPLILTVLTLALALRVLRTRLAAR